ncbi:hypothetical protein ACT3UQ_18990 [Glutamicibacter sp. AOP12-B1-11]|uniref:hypothetical protein n=1 Tax=Glutamicibacter sp. AOP12-B1-11 TaxID=3457725 RepID=UPI0040348675
MGISILPPELPAGCQVATVTLGFQFPLQQTTDLTIYIAPNSVVTFYGWIFFTPVSFLPNRSLKRIIGKSWGRFVLAGYLMLSVAHSSRIYLV